MGLQEKMELVHQHAAAILRLKTELDQAVRAVRSSYPAP